MPTLGAPELIIILVIILVIFGPKRLPGLGKQLGGGLREFKNSITSKADDDDEDDDADADEHKTLNAAVTEAPPSKPTSAEVVDSGDAGEAS